MGLVPFVVLLVIVATNSVWMPTWTYFVALGFGASAMLPMSLVYAISGYSMEVGIFNELVYGCRFLVFFLVHALERDEGFFD